MPATTQPKPETAPRTLIGWQGMRFLLPPDWNVTGFSLNRGEGYLKVDSPGTMFVQIKWNDPQGPRRPVTLAGLTLQLWRRWRPKPPKEPEPPDLRAVLDNFLKQVGKQARKAKDTFDYKVKPETQEANGERIAHHFSWTGSGLGQGKIWFCKGCGRTVIAQVVGQRRDNVAAVASELFAEIRDHAEDGWNTWALYDLVAGIPEDFEIRSQKLMSGYLKLEFGRRGGERILLERWGLANVARKKFTLTEWFEQTRQEQNARVTGSETTAQEHPAVCVAGWIRGVFNWLRALRDARPLHRPAARYEGCAWECPETNKIYAVQVWHNVCTQGLLEEVVARCECH